MLKVKDIQASVKVKSGQVLNDNILYITHHHTQHTTHIPIHHTPPHTTHHTHSHPSHTHIYNNTACIDR
jgi:hypothetical protein